VPTVVHWGADLGELSESELAVVADSAIPAVGPSSVDVPMKPSVVPLLADGWNGQPGLDGFHLRGSSNPARRPALHCLAIDAVAENAVAVHLLDDADLPGTDALSLTLHIELTREGLLRVRHTLTNLSDSPFVLAALSSVLPVAAAATERLDFSGVWAAERAPQRNTIEHGTWLRESRHGRPGHDDSFILSVGTAGFGYRTGQVWAFHLGWSGDKRTFIDSSASGHTIAGFGELLAPGEITLATSESYESPWLYAAYSDAGLDGISRRFHEWFRALPAHPLTPRPLTANTWEAVYFDHSFERVGELAELAARVGVERFVLDDGWMAGRVDATRALGDWRLDFAKWPEGLHPLSNLVTSLGMEFGLWVEPEMVSLNSDVAREHPEWILRDSSSHLPLSWRDQFVLDLTNNDAFGFVLDALCSLLDEYPISYLKWDMNRDLLGGSSHNHVHATWRLMDALAASYPKLEIESCASGGGRIDAGMLERTHRVWPSDTNDSLDRQQIYRSTTTLVPPEYLGSHVGAATAHTTGRTHDLGFRLATALFGHAGIEWDLTQATDAELESLSQWATRYKDFRALLHSGNVVRGDDEGTGRWLHGVVNSARTEAIFMVAWTATSPVAIGRALRIPGLDPSRLYTVSPVDLGAGGPRFHGTPPPWWEEGEISTTGTVLETMGIPLPVVMVEQALVLHVTIAD
jgi:alpha-galactosidase